jgi:O-acetyl-ADP-ribose deacetylase (regulator of RNase III)
MDVEVAVGDVLEASADVLISTANPWLNMSGGVNGAICEQCPEIQQELHSWLEENFKTSIPAGTATKTSAGSLPFSHIVHAVAIDPFYDSSLELVSKTLVAAFDMVLGLGAKTVSMPTLATGFGPLSHEEFGFAFRKCIIGQYQLERIAIVVRTEEHANALRGSLFP